MATTIEWLTSAEIARRLRISRNRLGSLIDSGILIPGEHFIMLGRSRRYDCQMTEQALREMTRQRCHPQVGETYVEDED